MAREARLARLVKMVADFIVAVGEGGGVASIVGDGGGGCKGIEFLFVVQQGKLVILIDIFGRINYSASIWRQTSPESYSAALRWLQGRIYLAALAAGHSESCTTFIAWILHDAGKM